MEIYANINLGGDQPTDFHSDLLCGISMTSYPTSTGRSSAGVVHHESDRRPLFFGDVKWIG